MRRHLTVLVLTENRLVLTHVDDHPADSENPAPSAAATTESVPLDRIQNVGLTHVLEAPERYRASTLSAEAAAPLLAALDFSPQEVAEICHAIAAHSFSAGISCETALARVVQDADRIESLGAIGLARCFAVSGALGRPLFHPIDPFATDRTLNDTAFALDHFAQKLLKLPDQMQTETGRILARQRADILRRFLLDLAQELGQPAPNW